MVAAFLAARFLLPTYLVREQENVVLCPVRRNGDLVTPTAGTGRVYNASGTLVHSSALVVTNRVATLTVPAVDLPATTPYEERWRVEFQLTVDGEEHLFKNSALLVRSELRPVVTDQDLYRRQRALSTANKNKIHDLNDFQEFRDEAWLIIISRLSQKGSLTHLIAEPTSLREAHLNLSLSLVYEAFATKLSEAYSEQALMYRERFEHEFGQLSFEYADDDGVAYEEKRPATGIFFTSGRR